MIPELLVIHHTASSRDKTTVADVDNWHKLRWANFRSSLGFWVGYHCLITADGKITQTRRPNELGAHCIPNEGKVGICLAGNFEFEKPTPEQLESLGKVILWFKNNYNFTDEEIKAHCELSSTLCPGKYLKDWLNKYRKISFLKRQIEKIKKLIEALLKGRQI